MYYLVRWKTDPEIAAKYDRKTNLVTEAKLLSVEAGKEHVRRWESDADVSDDEELEKPKDFLTPFWEKTF